MCSLATCSTSPIVWGDELASLLFLWLAMLGSVVAMRRGEHMRLTSFIARLPVEKRAFVDTLGAVIVITFIGLLFTPAWEYVSDEWIITTAALEIPNAFRVSAIAVGLSLMLMTCVARLLTSARLIDFSVSVAMLASLAALLWVAEGTAAADGQLEPGDLLHDRRDGDDRHRRADHGRVRPGDGGVPVDHDQHAADPGGRAGWTKAWPA